MSPCLLKVRIIVFGDCVTWMNPVLVAAAKHEAFLKARGRHYSNEAEAMKVRTCTFLRQIYILPRLCSAR